MQAEAVGAARGVRAFELRLIEFNNPEPPRSAVPGQLQESEASVLIEGLEPGLNYIWRLRFPSDSGVIVTQTVTCEAPVCPADMR